ncbi:MAG TPA: 50S ribosomal protein L11 methyltransferase [Steroidobacteraceae bacterium]|nr:50S ribosomal protein L11 methyltransferase [Steroidobacteraceae bacterium]
MHLELSFELGSLDPQIAEDACWECGACALTFVDARDDAILEPAPGEFRLWPRTHLKCLFGPGTDAAALRRVLASRLGLDPARLAVRDVAERVWEREWLEHFHAMRFGRRLWVSPHHEPVSAPGAVVVALDPGLAFGTGTHPSTALCLTWLDAYFSGSPVPAEHFVERRSQGLDAYFSDESLAPGARVIDYGCGSGVLALAAAKLGAHEAHCFDIDPQALIAARANATANAVAGQVRVHERPDTLPLESDVLLANILAGPLCALAPRFAQLLRPHGEVVLAGLMQHEVADVTEAYAPCFDVVPFGERDGWVALAGRRR